jgi:hypothetical protein
MSVSGGHFVTVGIYIYMYEVYTMSMEQEAWHKSMRTSRTGSDVRLRSETLRDGRHVGIHAWSLLSSIPLSLSHIPTSYCTPLPFARGRGCMLECIRVDGAGRGIMAALV